MWGRTLGPELLARETTQGVGGYKEVAWFAVFTQGKARVNDVGLEIDADADPGMPLKLRLRPAPGQRLRIPQDLLAVLGGGWRPLKELSSYWRGTLKVKLKEPARTPEIESQLCRALAHLSETLALVVAAGNGTWSVSTGWWMIACRRVSVPRGRAGAGPSRMPLRAANRPRLGPGAPIPMLEVHVRTALGPPRCVPWGVSARGIWCPKRSAEWAREWRERHLRGHAGDGVHSMLRELLADLPKVRTPWEQVLRTQLARGLSHKPALPWSRPSRSYLANHGRLGGPSSCAAMPHPFGR